MDALLQSFAAAAEQLGVQVWLAHGTLLGWHWNQQRLPWDTDLDFQISIRDLYHLARSYNFTSLSHQSRTYLLDINPNFEIVSVRDIANKIDARWIDTRTGKYIDITALHRDPVPFTKDGHRYRVRQLLLHPFNTHTKAGNPSFPTSEE